VDDDPDIRQFLMDRLGSYGYVVETANDGREAFDALRKGSYNGLILDIGLPEIDGMEVLHQIREDMPTLPVMMVTASGSKERAVQAVNLGAQAYLLKPFDAEHLKQMVEQCFGPAL
jgi:DNA-binding response OmpR family regulator